MSRRSELFDLMSRVTVGRGCLVDDGRVFEFLRIGGVDEFEDLLANDVARAERRFWFDKEFRVRARSGGFAHELDLLIAYEVLAPPMRAVAFLRAQPPVVRELALRAARQAFGLSSTQPRPYAVALPEEYFAFFRECSASADEGEREVASRLCADLSPSK